jgi:hypothetical protein
LKSFKQAVNSRPNPALAGLFQGQKEISGIITWLYPVPAWAITNELARLVAITSAMIHWIMNFIVLLIFWLSSPGR